MCGITGVIRLDGSSVEPAVLIQMTDQIAHRGPDGAGHWISPDGCIGLGHRRLAIIDVSEAASQPMHYLGRYTITYNGEIYNYIELKEELLGKGLRFATQSDTEVILGAYAAYGRDCIRKFDGMFAFAVWDRVERQLFCARDRFGEKPFYYHYVPGRRFVFASEMKALFAADVEQTHNLRMLFSYLAYDVVQDPFRPTDTFYEGVASLEPAHILVIQADGRGTERPRRYWQINSEAQRRDVGFEEASDQVRALLVESVRRRLRSDVSLGSSLSGGIDSSSIVCIVAGLVGWRGRTQKTFSARFSDEALDEGPYIGVVAERANAAAHYVWPNAQGLAASLERVLHYQEEPFGSANIYAQWEVMRLAKENGTVVLLDGQGADEILGGYLHFFRPYLLRLFKTDAPRFRTEVLAYESLHKRPFDAGWKFRLEARAPKLMRFVGDLRRQVITPNYLRWLSRDFIRSYRTEQPPFKSFENLNKALTFFSQNYGLRNLLRFADRSSMAFSREVRLPYLSHELVEFLFTLPDSYKVQAGWTKRILRHAMAGIVPEPVQLRVEKLGFEAPQQEWMQSRHMRPLIEESGELLLRERIIESGEYPKNNEWRVLMGGLLLKQRPWRR
jgi:asparagine synthase (glutamine-hydrolysing)